MDKKEIFRIFDACQPTVAQVKEYLEQISGNSPFELIFVKDGKEKMTKKIEPGLGKLLGVIIGKTVFYAQGFGKEQTADKEIVTVEDVLAFGASLHPKAVPMDQDALDLLRRHRLKYRELVEKLKVFDYNALSLQQSYLLFEKKSPKTYAREFDIFGIEEGGVDIRSFALQQNIFFCASWK